MRTDFKYMHLDAEKIMSLYSSGESVKSLSKRFGVSRGCINTVLKKNGIVPRNGSESMFLRMSRTPVEERKRLALSANKKRRSSPASETELINKAIAAQRIEYRVGEFEDEVATKMIENGFNPARQYPFRRYNFDLAYKNIAIEIQVGTTVPLKIKRIQRKTAEAIRSGWNIVFLWVSPTKRKIDQQAFDELIRYVKKSISDPSYVGNWKMIRGVGGTYAEGSLSQPLPYVK